MMLYDLPANDLWLILFVLLTVVIINVTGYDMIVSNHTIFNHEVIRYVTGAESLFSLVIIGETLESHAATLALLGVYVVLWMAYFKNAAPRESNKSEAIDDAPGE